MLTMNRNFSLTVTFKPEQENDSEFQRLAEQWNIGLEVRVVNSAKIVNESYRVIRTPITNIDPLFKVPDNKLASTK